MSGILEISHDNKSNEYRLDKPITTMGRSADNDIVLSEDIVSRHHALLEWVDNTLYITDSGSTNGTIVNGTQIEPQMRFSLKDGDVLSIGNYVIMFRMTEAIEETPVSTAIPQETTVSEKTWDVESKGTEAPVEEKIESIPKEKQKGPSRNVLVAVIAGVIIVAGVLLAVLLIPGREGGAPQSTTASLSEATMCRSVDPQTAKPVEPVEVFTPDTEAIYCSVKLSDATPDTEITAHWVYIRGEAKDIINTVLHEDIRTESGSTYLSFSMPHPKTGFVKGNYVVRLLIYDTQQLSVPFTVE
jgi:pSer/pThr/pTyr-binding forkhead associated (FHA) protein